MSVRKDDVSRTPRSTSAARSRSTAARLARSRAAAEDLGSSRELARLRRRHRRGGADQVPRRGLRLLALERPEEAALLRRLALTRCTRRARALRRRQRASTAPRPKIDTFLVAAQHAVALARSDAVRVLALSNEELLGAAPARPSRRRLCRTARRPNARRRSRRDAARHRAARAPPLASAGVRAPRLQRARRG